jgi:dynein heavy chain 1
MVVVCDGKEKPNNHVRDLFKFIRKDKLPKNWTTPSKNLAQSVWIEDFSRRIEHMQKVSASKPSEYENMSFWLGGFFTPEAFVAATRQAVAQKHSWSLESLELKVAVDDTSNSADGFTFEGLTLHGAGWNKNLLCITNEMSFNLPPTRFYWVKKDKKPEQEEEDEKQRGEVCLFFSFLAVRLFLDHSSLTLCCSL